MALAAALRAFTESGGSVVLITEGGDNSVENGQQRPLDHSQLVRVGVVVRLTPGEHALVVAGAGGLGQVARIGFEKSGWRETQVVVRFWIITMMLVLFGLSTLKLR